eukprot:134133-Hanusia_phi.AAC.1
MATFFHEGEQTLMPVSEFVAAKLASRAKTSTLKSLVSDSTIRNPSVKGCLFEMLFFELMRGE